MLTGFDALVRHTWKLWVLVALAIIVFFSLAPPPENPKPALFPHVDKVLHLLAYSFLAYPVGHVQPPRALLLVAAFALMSIGIEFLQPYFGRSNEVSDMAFNGLGLALGFCAGLGLYKVVMARRSSPL